MFRKKKLKNKLFNLHDPIRTLFRTLHDGFACLLSGWRTATIQDTDDYRVCICMYSHHRAQTNWKIFKIAVISVFCNHKTYVRAALNPSLHFFADHSGVRSTLAGAAHCAEAAAGVF